MKTKFTLITKHISLNKFWSRSFNSVERAIETGEILKTREYERHDIIGLVVGKNNGHRWILYVRDPEDKKSEAKISLCSKKDVIFAIKLIKKYNKELWTTYIKKY